MKQILHKLLDVIFPPRESELTLRTHHPEDTPLSDTCFEGVFCCSEYTNPIINAAIRENKFYNNLHAQVILADCLSRWVTKKNLEAVCFIPVPLGKKRLHQRGHNQVLSVLRQSNFQHTEAVLERSVETVPQTTLTRTERLQNSQGVFSCDQAAMKNISQRTIILLDDVVTTGATLNEARATLAPHLPPNTKLICVALAH
jgi:predicted amidophosphoribosyltransferase